MTVAISVIIPCYNSAQFLASAIDSVLRQSTAAHEVIVVDDGSTDGSAEVARAYGRAITLVQQPNKGEGGARNAGADVATGTHFLFLDADDLLTTEALKELSDAASLNPDAVVLMRSVTFTDEPTQPTSAPTNPPATFFPDLIRGCIGVPHTWLTPSVVYRRTHGFKTSGNYFIDWEFWCQVALLNPPLVALSVVGALYRRHPKAMSANTPTRSRVRGHVAVMETLTAGMLSQPELLARYGEDLFWGSWIALERGRRYGMSWRELNRLMNAIVATATRGPDGLRRTRAARAIRCLGFRPAYYLRRQVSEREFLQPGPQDAQL